MTYWMMLIVLVHNINKVMMRFRKLRFFFLSKAMHHCIFWYLN